VTVWSGIVRTSLKMGKVVAAAPRLLARARLPLRVHLAIFASVLLLPAFLLSAVLLREAANERRREAELRLVQLANDLADDISNDLERSITVLRTLSYSASLKEASLETFHAQASSLTGGASGTDSAVLLLGPDGRQLVNTAVPWGTLLMPYSEPEALARAVETKAPVVTNLFWGRLRNQYVLNVLFPVVEAGTVTSVLALSLTPQHILALLQGQDLGSEWTTAIVDGRGVVIARSRAHEIYMGRKISNDVRGRVTGNVHPADSIDGRRILRVAMPTRTGGWIVAAAVSEDYVNLLALRAVKNLVIGSVVILGLAGLLVTLYGRELAGSVASITRAMEDGPKDTMVREASEAAERLQEASKALRDSEERFRSIFQNAATGIALAGLDELYVACNPAFSRICGYSHDQIIGRKYSDIMHPDDRAENTRMTQSLLREEIPSFEIENRYRTPSGQPIWVQKHLSLTRDGRGRPSGILTLVTDMTDRRENERALALAVERSRIAQQTAHAALYEHTPEGEMIYGDAFVALTGYSTDEGRGLARRHKSLIHPEDAERVRNAIEAGLAAGEGYDVDYRLRHASGRYVWVHDRASVLRDQSTQQSRVIGMLIDISEQKAREEHINLLLREVNHRSKNMLGLVQAIARQTVATSPTDFLTRFSERIQALSANQDLLVRNEWGGIDLEELIEAQLAHMVSMPNPRVKIMGPRLHMNPAAAQVIGMVMHELATNASKYGAFSGKVGRLDITWSITDDESFSIAWRESNGPVVTPPERTGFGSTVVGTMARMGLEAEVSHEFAPTGVVWTLTCALSRVLDRSVLPSDRRTPIATERALPKPGAPRILIVEDEALIALELMETLSANGFAPFGPARSASEALTMLARERCDAAVLDVTLGHETAEPVARALYARHVPFVVASGYEQSQLAQELRTAPFLRKPVDSQSLVRELRALLKMPVA
jgi:PAS domain S-box-containing protein